MIATKDFELQKKLESFSLWNLDMLCSENLECGCGQFLWLTDFYIIPFYILQVLEALNMLYDLLKHSRIDQIYLHLYSLNAGPRRYQMLVTRLPMLKNIKTTIPERHIPREVKLTILQVSQSTLMMRTFRFRISKISYR